MTTLDVTSRKLLSLQFTLPFGLGIHLRGGWPNRDDGQFRSHLHHFLLRWRNHLSWSHGVPMYKSLDAPQIARFRFAGVSRTDFSCSPSAGEARQERRQIWLMCARSLRLAALRKQYQITLHGAHALRAVALGRKNFLFAGSDTGGQRAAAMYTLIGTAKLCGLDPQAYLQYILERIAEHPINKLDELLPWNASAKLPSLRLAA